MLDGKLHNKQGKKGCNAFIIILSFAFYSKQKKP